MNGESACAEATADERGMGNGGWGGKGFYPTGEFLENLLPGKSGCGEFLAGKNLDLAVRVFAS